MSINQYMTEHHRLCDQHFANAEQAASEERWEEARREYDSFKKEIEQHFHMEEGVLFPEFEEQTGMTAGPTAVMRMEHEEIRRLLDQMNMALDGNDADSYLGTSETLLIMMQQHNMKEEQMLYPMAEQELGALGGEVLRRMQAV